MIDPAIVEVIAPLGIGGIVALIVFYYARVDMNRHIASLERLVDEYGATTKTILTVVNQNTEAFTKTKGTLDLTHSVVKELKAEVSELRHENRTLEITKRINKAQEVTNEGRF